MATRNVMKRSAKHNSLGIKKLIREFDSLYGEKSRAKRFSEMLDSKSELTKEAWSLVQEMITKFPHEAEGWHKASFFLDLQASYMDSMVAAIRGIELGAGMGCLLQLYSSAAQYAGPHNILQTLLLATEKAYGDDEGIGNLRRDWQISPWFKPEISKFKLAKFNAGVRKNRKRSK